MQTDEYALFDALGLASLIQDKEVSVDEVVHACTERITALNGDLNAVVRLFDTADNRRRLNYDKPSGIFRGVPILIKDDLLMAHTPMNFGSALLDGYVCEDTHPVARNINDVGFVVMGRSNMCEFGLMPTTEPIRFGATKNPWNTEYSSGGSSGGSAVAVATGMVPIAHGTDGGGSLRIPASACGIFGLKCSRGRHIAMPKDPPTGFAVHGCLTRTVRDSASFLDSIQTPAANNRWKLHYPESSYLEIIKEMPKKLRIGMTATGWWREDADAEVQRSLMLTVDKLHELGHEVEQVDPPFDPLSFMKGLRVIFSSIAGMLFRVASQEIKSDLVPDWMLKPLRNPRNLRRLSGLPLRNRFPLVEPFTRRIARTEDRTSPSELWVALSLFSEAERKLTDWFSGYDLWLTPPLMQHPKKLGALIKELSGGLSVEEIEKVLLSYIGFEPIANHTGFPAVSIPICMSQSGIPMGAHFMAANGREDLLLRLAAQFERVFPWPNCSLKGLSK